MPDLEDLDILAPFPISLEEQLCPATPNERAERVHRFREAITRNISSSVPPIEKMLGLELPNSAFRYDLSEAILLCILMHVFPPERRSHDAKELKEIGKDAAAAEKNAGLLMSRLENAQGIYPLIKDSFLAKLRQHASDYASLSKLAYGHAAALKDPGGQIGLIAFQTLVDRLIRAFESATKTRATVKYNKTERTNEGHFLEFMRKVLSIMYPLFPKISYPSSGLAVDNFIYKRVNSPDRQTHKEVRKGKGARSHRRRRVSRNPNVRPLEARQHRHQKSNSST